MSDKARNTKRRVLARAIGRLQVAEHLLCDLAYYNIADEVRRIKERLQAEDKDTPRGLDWPISH